MTYGTPCQAIGYVVSWYHHVTYRTPCHVSGPSAADLRERFYLTLHTVGFKASLGAGSSTSKLAGLHADLRKIAPVRLLV